jgi:hypothetical protein
VDQHVHAVRAAEPADVPAHRPRRPDGYEWDADGTPYDATHLLDAVTQHADGDTVHDAVSYLLKLNLAVPPHEERINTLDTFVRENGGRLNNDMIIGLLSLIAAMPEYQLC